MKRILSLFLIVVIGFSCVACGGVTGNVTESVTTECAHQYLAATCDTPAKCNLCGKTDGSALGHRTDFGKCSACGTKINYSVLTKIEGHLEQAEAYSELAVGKLDNSSSFTTVAQWEDALNSIASYYAKAKDEYKKAYDLCGNISALSSLKSYIKTTMDAAPVTWDGNASNTTDITTFLRLAQAYVYCEGTTLLELEIVKEKFK